MFYETMEDLLPGMKIIITDGDTQTIYPLDSFVNISGNTASTDVQSGGSKEGSGNEEDN
jgi:membrane protease subunit HflK